MSQLPIVWRRGLLIPKVANKTLGILDTSWGQLWLLYGDEHTTLHAAGPNMISQESLVLPRRILVRHRGV